MSRAHLTAFFDEIERVCRAYGLAIGHEDNHGGFQIAPFDPSYMDWLRAAYLEEGEIVEDGTGEAPK